MNTQERSFAESPEAQEYITKLQQDRLELPAQATQLEREAFDQLKSLTNQIRNITATQNDIEKQIEQFKMRVRGLEREADSISGQMAAFASMLVSAEGARRDDVAEKAKAPLVPEGSVPKPADDSATSESDAQLGGKSNGKAKTTAPGDDKQNPKQAKPKSKSKQPESTIQPVA